ncbi:MAG: hydroxyacid dehydrogenase [Rhodobacteraceae bacterium]|nr:hydroxyacid dehydrogenase [Paracoccaceae bacterium]
MAKLVVVQSLRPEAYQLLQERGDVDYEITEDFAPDALTDRIEGADALTVRVAPLPEHVLDAAPDLKVISRHGVGYDNIPVDYCTRRGIAVAVTANANSVSVAEHALFLMLAAARNANVMDSAVRNNRFGERLNWIGLELMGRTLLIVGYGRIGRQLAVRAKAFGMRVLVHDPFVQCSDDDDVEIIGSLQDALREADVLSIHVPLTRETSNLIGGREMDLLRDRAILVNASRGGLVDEAALLQRIRSGKLHGAGIDVFESEPPPPDSPLLNDPRIILSPHSAALTEESLIAMGRLAVQNALDGIDGRLRPEMVVNPSVLN